MVLAQQNTTYIEQNDHFNSIIVYKSINGDTVRSRNCILHADVATDAYTQGCPPSQIWAER